MKFILKSKLWEFDGEWRTWTQAVIKWPWFKKSRRRSMVWIIETKEADFWNELGVAEKRFWDLRIIIGKRSLERKDFFFIRKTRLGIVNSFSWLKESQIKKLWTAYSKCVYQNIQLTKKSWKHSIVKTKRNSSKTIEKARDMKFWN